MVCLKTIKYVNGIHHTEAIFLTVNQNITICFFFTFNILITILLSEDRRNEG